MFPIKCAGNKRTGTVFTAPAETVDKLYPGEFQRRSPLTIIVSPGFAGRAGRIAKGFIPCIFTWSLRFRTVKMRGMNCYAILPARPAKPGDTISVRGLCPLKLPWIFLSVASAACGRRFRLSKDLVLRISKARFFLYVLNTG